MVPTFTSSTRTYCLLTKPGIIMGNAITTAGGFALASKGQVDLLLFLATLLGLSLVIASGCVFNNYIDRHADQKMARTKNRALATGAISNKNAWLFASVLILTGTSFLTLCTNLLTTFIALFGFFVYVVLYSFSKYHSVHGTLIGSVAGAVPPVAGYCAVSGRLDMGALILFALVVLWQMPHFFAIAIFRLGEYAKASIPVLPLVKGIFATKVQMVLYVAGFFAVSLLLPAFHYVGHLYLIIASLLSTGWLALSLQGFRCTNDKLWARKMFVCSLIVIMGLCIAIPFGDCL